MRSVSVDQQIVGFDHLDGDDLVIDPGDNFIHDIVSAESHRHQYECRRQQIQLFEHVLKPSTRKLGYIRYFISGHTNAATL